MIQTVGCPNSSLAVITFSDSSAAPGREQDDVVSSQYLCLARGLNMPDPPLPDMGCIQQAITL